MPFNFDNLPNRRSTESAKWRVYDEDVLPMWVADMDFPSPKPVIKALQDRVAHGVFGYPCPKMISKNLWWPGWPAAMAGR